MKIVKKCDNCGKSDFQFLYKNHNVHERILGEFGVFQCKSCKLIFLNPQPDEQVVSCGKIQADLAKGTKFEVIDMGDALSHTRNPSALLKKVSKMLEKGGVVHLELPNPESQAHALFRKHWSLLATPYHQYLFTVRNVESYAKKNGFRVLNVSYRKGSNDFSNSLILGVAAKMRKNVYVKDGFLNGIFRLLPVFGDSVVQVTLKKV